MTSVILNENIGAVVRSNGPYTGDVDFHSFNDHFVHTFVDYLQDNAKKICGRDDPDIYLIGYSSGGSGIASIAAEYKAIKKMLLLAPSYDSDKEKLKKSLNRYRGELYILVGDRDEVVLPEQVYWFFKQSKKTKVCKYIELISCEHPFIGKNNHQKLLKAPLWAFKGTEYDQD
jgi:alpha/beta superfamily hydrolase